MTDATNADELHPVTYPDLSDTSDWFAAPDFTLQHMADFANRADVGLGVTLVLSGTVVTGTVISAHQFYEEAASYQRSTVAGHEEPAIRELVDKYSEMMFDQAAQSYDQRKIDDTRIEMTRYIHLQNTRILVPGVGQVPSGNGNMRVLLSRVSAWSIGGLPIRIVDPDNE